MGKRKALYLQGSNETFKLSRLNIQNYLDCPLCFYIENIHGIKKPSGYPLTINSDLFLEPRLSFAHR